MSCILSCIVGANAVFQIRNMTHFEEMKSLKYRINKGEWLKQPLSFLQGMRESKTQRNRINTGSLMRPVAF